MARARKDQTDLTKPGRYLCRSSCVRQSPYLGSIGGEGKSALMRRIRELSGAFVIDVLAVSVIDSTFGIVLQTDPPRAQRLSARRAVRRWFQVYPANTRERGAVLIQEHPDLLRRTDPNRPIPDWLLLEAVARDAATVDELRTKLGSLSCYMKALKQQIAAECNRRDDVRGPFWDGRYDSVNVVTDLSLLQKMLTVDLLPARAGDTTDSHPYGYSSWAHRVRECRVVHGARRHSRTCGRRQKRREGRRWLGSIRRATGITVAQYLKLLRTMFEAMRDECDFVIRQTSAKSVKNGAAGELSIPIDALRELRLSGEGPDGHAARWASDHAERVRQAHRTFAKALPRIVATLLVESTGVRQRR